MVGAVCSILGVPGRGIVPPPPPLEEDESLSRLAIRELGLTGLLPSGAKVINSRVVRLSRSYPVYERGYLQHLQTVQAYLDTIPRLLTVGRYGAFKYNNQDHSILMGLLAAAEIISGERQELWSINTDTEYQESPLVKQMFPPSENEAS